jgi:membrane fusion protein, multidrug efflux system
LAAATLNPWTGETSMLVDSKDILVHETPAKLPRDIVQQIRAHFRFLLPTLVLLAVIALVTFAANRWNTWTGLALLQSTDDAYVSADVTRLSTRISGQVSSVAVVDFQSVKAGELLIQIDPADYHAQVDLASATLAASLAALDILSDQIKLQLAVIARAEATLRSTEAIEVETREEQERQQALSQTDAGTRQRLEQATAAYSKAQADVRAGGAAVAEQHHQLEVLQGTGKQRAAEVDGAKATLAAAKLKLSYTRIVAPFDGVVSGRQVQSGDYVNVGSNFINIVPLPNVYVIANYKETQLTHIRSGQFVDIAVDSFPEQSLRGYVERISPASGSQFALLPPDNATGNFTKVVQRIPVRIAFEKDQPLLARLLPGMSVVTRIHVSKGADD